MFEPHAGTEKSGPLRVSSDSVASVEEQDYSHQESGNNAKRGPDGGDMYNPISQGISSQTGHPTEKEKSRIVVDAAPIAPFLTCKIRNVARSSLEYDYTDYFVDTTLGPCEITVHQDVVISCLKVYYFFMAEACRRYAVY